MQPLPCHRQRYSRNRSPANCKLEFIAYQSIVLGGVHTPGMRLHGRAKFAASLPQTNPQKEILDTRSVTCTVCLQFREAVNAALKHFIQETQHRFCRPETGLQAMHVRDRWLARRSACRNRHLRFIAQSILGKLALPAPLKSIVCRARVWTRVTLKSCIALMYISFFSYDPFRDVYDASGLSLSRTEDALQTDARFRSYVRSCTSSLASFKRRRGL